MKRFEYMWVVVKDEISTIEMVDHMNALGNEGWATTGITEDLRTATSYFMIREHAS